uniref:MarR family transcriptional regulator n=1 Tax=Variovorax paradoxus (strain S110) TaxID=543728 RepID=C5CJN3_VARPS
MTRPLQILKMMAVCKTMTAERASTACGCDLRAAQNTLGFMVDRGFIEVESKPKRFRAATYRITPAGVQRSTFTPKVPGETGSQRAARRERWALSTDAALDALDRDRAAEQAREAVAIAMRREVPNSVFALGSMA